MPEGSIFVRIAKPFTANKRFFGLMVVSFLVLGGFGALYYFYIQGNQAAYKEYRLQILDQHYNRVDRQVSNWLLSELARENLREAGQEEVRLDSLSLERQKLEDEISAAQMTVKRAVNLKQQLTDDLQLTETLRQRKEAVNEEIERLRQQIKADSAENAKRALAKTPAEILKDKSEKIYRALPWGDRFDAWIVLHQSPNRSKPEQFSSLVGNLLVNEDSIFAKASFKSGVMKEVRINEADYQLFARKYSYTDTLSTSEKTELAKITLIGLVRSDRYMRETHRLDAWVISLIATILLLALFGLPLFKVLFIAGDERLFGSDVMAAGITIVVGGPIIIVVFLSLFTYSYRYYLDTPDQLKSFGESISKAFTEENKQIVRQMNSLDLAELREEVEFSLFMKEQDDSGRYIPVNAGDTNFQTYSDFKTLSRIDGEGRVDYHFSFVKAPEKRTNDLSRRSYFKDFVVHPDDVWFQQNDSDAIEYVMRPVIAIEDQTEEAVYITAQKAAGAYAVGSVQLKSLHDPILPLGYQFAVLNDEGKVWFHSEPNRALLEDFFQSSKKNKELKAAVAGRVQAHGRLYYQGKNHLYSVHPIPKTSMSIVVLYDISLLRLKVSEVLSIAGVAILVAFLVASLIALISAFVQLRRRRLTKYKEFVFHFLEPQSVNEADYVYLRKLFLGIIIVTLVVASLWQFSPSQAFITSMQLIIWSYVLVYYRLQPHRLKGFANALNRHSLYLWKAKTRELWSLSLRDFELRDWLILMGLGFWNLCVYSVTSGWDHRWVSVCAELIFVTLMVTSLRNKWSERPKAKPSDPGRHFKFHYATFLCTWLTITSVIPAFFYFNQAWTVEDLIWGKYDQVYMANQYLEKRTALLENLKLRDTEEITPEDFWSPSPLVHNYHDYLSHGLYLKEGTSLGFNLYDQDSDLILGKKVPEGELRRAIWKYRPIYDPLVYETLPLVFRSASDLSWVSSEALTEARPRLALGKRTLSMLNDKGMIIARSTLRSSFTDGFPLIVWMVLIVGVIIIVAALFFIINFYIDRFFGYSFQYLKPNDFHTSSDNGYAEKLALMLEGLALSHKELKEVDPAMAESMVSSNSGLMLIGLPFTGKRDFAMKVIEHSKFKDSYAFISCLELSTLDEAKLPTGADKLSWIMNSVSRGADRNQLPADKWKEAEVIVLENLEHDGRSVSGNRKKLQVITYLLSLSKRLIILSEVYPGQILAFFREQVDEQGRVVEEVASDYASWRNVLGEFPQVLIGMNHRASIVNRVLANFEKHPDEKRLDEESKKAFTSELGYSRFLPTLADAVLLRNVYQNREGQLSIDDERMVLHTQHLAHGFYNDIWNSLARRERYLLYDLAMDGFMNTKNSDSLFSLMKKGIVVWKDKPAVFNNSFRNFIISSASKSEALDLERKNRQTGAWSFARIVIYMVIIALVGLLVLGEPGLIQDFKAFVGAIASIGAILPVVSSLLSGKSG